MQWRSLLGRTGKRTMRTTKLWFVLLALLKVWSVTSFAGLDAIAQRGGGNHLAALAHRTDQIQTDHAQSNENHPDGMLSYDVCIIGAGAAGLFASGAATMLGQSCALIDLCKLDEGDGNGGQPDNVSSGGVGGDCTNAACVPSKALRSAAQQKLKSWTTTQQYIRDTVQAVRRREDPDDVEIRSDSNVQVHLVESCRFVSGTPSRRNSLAPKLQLQFPNQPVVTLQAKNVLIATGASPRVDDWIKEQAQHANLPLFTYRSVLRPELNQEFWNLLADSEEQSTSSESTANVTKFSEKTLAIIGGGATACELGQALARLRNENDSSSVKVNLILIAPSILPNEDATLSRAATDILLNEGVDYISKRLVEILPDKRLVVLDDEASTKNGTQSTRTIIGPVDGILICTGRSPRESLQSLALDEAGIAWTDKGLTVNPWTLQSTTRKHVFAAGDCADAVQPRFRTAAQAAWTGFHAIRNMIVPSILRTASRSSVHPCVPRVIYTDPELACIGLTKNDCDAKYNGPSGCDSVLLYEDGSDRADMERTARNTSLSFLELRAEKGGGRVLGLTCCGPAAAELANAVGIAITNKLTVRDLARSLHSYPSYGYLLHRIALSMALSDMWGLLEVCGPVGRFLAIIGRAMQSFLRSFCRVLTLSRSPPSPTIGGKVAS